MAGKKVNRLIVPNTYYMDGMAPVTSVNNILPVNGNVTLPIPTVPTNVSAFTNDAGYLTLAMLNGYATQSWVQQQGYLTSVPSQYITDAELSTTLADYVTNTNLSTILAGYAQTTDIPTVGNGTITINQGGVLKGTFTVNQSGNSTINLDAVGSVSSVNGQTGAVVLTASDVGALPSSTTIPTKTSDLTNDSGFITNSALSPYALSSNLATVATSGSYSDLSNKPTIPAAQVQSDWNQTDNTAVDFIKNKPTIPSGVVVDQTFDGTSANAQSGVAITGAGFLTSSDLTYYVTTNTDQNITGTKTFVGQKKIGFKQSSSSDKLGFTLYNSSNVEKGYLEYNPSNTVDSVPLMTLGNYASLSTGLTHVGFRKYSSVSGASGAYNLLAPLISEARTPFNLTTTYTNFYLPLGFTDGTTTVKTAKSGMVDISSFGYVKNTATASTSLALLGSVTLNNAIALGNNATSSANRAIAIGYSANASGGDAVAIGSSASATDSSAIAFGDGAEATSTFSTAFGAHAKATANNAIQIGYGTNNTSYSLQVSFGTGISASNNYPLLDGLTGLIPDARISTNIARTSQLPTVPTNISSFTNDSGYITGITSSDVTTALGYTPYSDANPNGYTTNVGTVTSVNNSQPDASGNVTLSIPTVPTNVSAFTNDSGYQTSSDVNTIVTNAISTLLGNLYPVGSVYIGTQSTCPLETLISGSTWQLVAEDRVLQGASTNHSANTTVAAGLPNITGSISSRGYTTQYSGAITSASGAFTYTRNGQSGTSSPVTVTGTALKGDVTQFDASHSSSVYGNSTTVQPPAYVVNIWRRTA